MTIHALTDDEGEQCWKEMEGIINDNLTKHMHSICNEHEEVRRKRVELSMPREIEIAIKTVTGKVDKLDCCTVLLYRVFKQKIPSPGASDGDGLVSDTVTFTFVMCGESKAIEGIKTAICTKESGDCIERRVVKLPPGGVAVISKGLEQIQVSLCTLTVEISTNDPFNTVTISAPREVLGDLNKAEEIILSYVNNQKQTISLTDPIVALILASPQQNGQYYPASWCEGHCTKISQQGTYSNWKPIRSSASCAEYPTIANINLTRH